MTIPGAISGSTRLVGVIGDPIQQVQAPALWTDLFRANGVDAVCVPMHVTTAGLGELVTGAAQVRNLIGLIVTVPHKPAAFALSRRASARARRTGAANLLRFERTGPDGLVETVSDMVDGIGFVSALRARGFDPGGKSVLVVGAGGVGAALVDSLVEAGARSVLVHDNLPGRAAALAERFGPASGVRAGQRPGGPDPAEVMADLVVNATPIGMRAEDPLPFDCSRLRPPTVVADVVAAPDTTRLIEFAESRGCQVQRGMAMMHHQIPHVARFFGWTEGMWSPEPPAISGAARVGAPRG
ncbi:shikimate dehydrogenase family protein [Amycolatopsis granulosa]|uniref:shikimate dehydrogenase family protein n=1 Tax=Amycolatopsis granulosa TaxID=185684 RepID=UPI001423617D|nr:shikimate dehydrogenase [Amycolatopsis granulosa]NIH88355.1 shikimate dehydrogenase [Amycolatopsis granulosa]